jgi:hypothetical protein
MEDASKALAPGPTVVARLAIRIREARRLGFHVRQEYLGGNVGNWCEIGGRKTVFLDASQAAGEQLAVLEQAIDSYRPASDPAHVSTW